MTDVYDETEATPLTYVLPIIGVVVTFDGFAMEFTPTRQSFDDLRTPMQTEIIKALLNGALRLVEADHE